MTQQVYEQALRDLRPRWVLGIDEVGVGAWSGPVYAAAVLVPSEFQFVGLRDSKQTTEAQREAQYERLVSEVGSAWFWLAGRSPATIDRIGIRRTLDEMMAELVASARYSLAPAFDPCLLVVDGDHSAACSLPNVTQLVLPKADTFVPAVMAAANIAKVWRDRYMRSVSEEDASYAPYDFANGKGYGTVQHQRALAEYGVTNEHRVSYRPVGRCGPTATNLDM